MNALDDFRSVMRDAGLHHVGLLVTDGLLHRFKAGDDKDSNSWYVLHAGPPAAGAFGCWKRGFKETWCERNNDLSPEELARVQEQWSKAANERELAETQRHARAQKNAEWVLTNSKPAATHEYLTVKGVHPHGELRTYRGALIVPLRDGGGLLHSLQFIGADGSKRFLKGGRIVGCNFPMGTRSDSPLVLCEGYATGASIHEATGFDVVCAMNAGNLHAVVTGLRAQYPEREIIVAADNDQFTEGNPGLTKAIEAAFSARAKLVVPQFQDVSSRPTDFNDLHGIAGLAEVAQQISAAKPCGHNGELNVVPEKVSNLAIALPQEDEADATAAPKPFPVESLPPPLALIVSAVADCERVPPALPAVCALGVTSAAIGAGLEIVSAADRVTRANLFLLADAESGSGKSQVFRRIAEPIIEHQRQVNEAFQEKTAPNLASEIGLLTREIKRLEAKAAKESNDPANRERLLGELQFKNACLTELKQMSMSPCVICGDITSEKLAVLLAGNHETMFSASPEARQILEVVCGRYSSSSSTDEAIYLSGYSGDYLRVDRLGRDSLTLRKPCLTVLWLTQPDAMSRLFNTETLAQSGFLPRFLTCKTLATPKKIIAGEDVAVSYAVGAQWAGLIAGLLATYHVAEKPYRFEPSPEAKRLLDEFFNSIVDRRQVELSDLGQFAARYGEQAWRVALTFHAALYGLDAHNHSLDAETAQNAIGVVQWFINEQLGILARGRRQAAAEVEDEVMQLLDDRAHGKRLEPEERQLGRTVDYVTSRTLVRARITPTTEAAKLLLGRMESAGLLVGEDITPVHGGKTTKIFRRITNPVLKESKTK